MVENVVVSSLHVVSVGNTVTDVFVNGNGGDTVDPARVGTMDSVPGVVVTLDGDVEAGTLELPVGKALNVPLLEDKVLGPEVVTIDAVDPVPMMDVRPPLGLPLVTQGAVEFVKG